MLSWNKIELVEEIIIVTAVSIALVFGCTDIVVTVLQLGTD
jgi:hypothetical protein